jgi:hypothetical protein
MKCNSSAVLRFWLCFWDLLGGAAWDRSLYDSRTSPSVMFTFTALR